MNKNDIKTYSINKPSIKRIKKDIIQATGFNRQIARHLIDIISQLKFYNVNHSHSKIELIDNEKKGGFFVYIKSLDKNIDIEISLFRNQIEMFVADKLNPVLDMNTDPIYITEEINGLLTLWFTKDIIRETVLVNNHIIKDSFFYLDTANQKQILHRTIDLKYFFRKRNRVISQKFKAWVDYKKLFKDKSVLRSKKIINVPSLYNKQSFDYYFLFNDAEIINESFFKKIKAFSKKSGGKNLIFDLHNLKKFDSYKGKTKAIVPITDDCVFDILENIHVNEKSYCELMFEFQFYDDTGKWMGYCDMGYDYGMIGCKNDVKDDFVSIVKPYETVSLKEKLDEINLNFVDNNGKPVFNN